MKLIRAILFCLWPALSAPAATIIVRGPVSAPAQGASYTLLYDSFDSGGATVTCGNTGFFYYAGQGYFNDSSRIIGKVEFKLTAVGSITGKTFVCRIWTQSGDDFATNVASSTGVAGVDAWSGSTVTFIFASPYTTTGSTNYTISVDAGGVDASNYVNFHYIGSGVAAGAAPPGNLVYAVWGPSTGNDGKFGTESAPNEAQIKVYTSP